MLCYQATYEIADTGHFYTSPYYATVDEARNDAFRTIKKMTRDLGLIWSSLMNVNVIEVIVPDEEGS